ncbi:ArgS-related anticodon-binding protein NrtL [Streptomyces sp. RerS4]|uniref:ArgS-related anticodon-binding protein NrtL n=1 Tax=Streptomyces sp. RerS4 TaxID=2942449 RepID=UPI00201BA47F|nr:DALR anticodon-binding domain-containing protein [Streptomyces sp. RerS4]UQX02997.1 DALR anticodon-binding domain-containing protein [Streptomyces sp. RerS4]
MTPADLSRAVVRAVRRAVEDGELAGPAPARIVVERTRPGGVGEYATPVAFQLAKGTPHRPADVARELASRLAGEPGITRVEVTGPGFLNFTLAPRPAADLVREVLGRGLRYGYAEDAYEATAASTPAPGPRERAVRETVDRIRASQGQGPAAPRVAPLAHRDLDAPARYGADAARWAMLATPARETPQFDASLLVQDESNEFFLVRYAFTRVRALVREARRLGCEGEVGEAGGEPAHGQRVLALLGEYPLVLEAAAFHQAPERIARHLVAVADALLDFQYAVLPIGDEKPSAAHRARLALAEAAGTVLAGGLALLGIAPPDSL